MGADALRLAFEADSAGREEEALGHYRRAFEQGVPDEDLPGAMLGFGSTLRNVGSLDESVRVLSEAVERFPEHRAMRVFLAYSLFSAGRQGDAMRSLVEALYVGDPAPELERYRRAIEGYADDL
ncbi:MAG TPA: tetratricopeptide repeat protein [Gaiellaceae bacterium]|nr:tetratricopeptide repeat protein [Gaiellaceae bacterium]